MDECEVLDYTCDQICTNKKGHGEWADAMSMVWCTNALWNSVEDFI